MRQGTGNDDPQVIDGIKHAVDLNSEGKTESALQHLSELMETFPAAASLHGYAALFLSGAGRLNEAIEHGRQAIQFSPRSEMTSFVLFDSLWNAGQHMEALDEMKRLLTLRPSEEYSRMIEQWNLTEDTSDIS